MLNPDIETQSSSLQEQFTNAQPFKHLVIDNFLDSDFCDQLLKEFPEFDQANATNEQGTVGLKAVNENLSALGGAYRQLDDLILSPEFRHIIGNLTGINNLIYDPDYFGGGTHENRHGQELDPHVDFNFHPISRQHRRLNLIIYLNKNWQLSWGGALELHSDPRSDDNTVFEISPEFNRAVLFETTEFSWHGFRRIDLPVEEQKRSRKSVALYYYTEERPAAEIASEHSTVYVERPLPEHIQPGYQLTSEDYDSLMALLARRDQHLERLYDETHRLMERNQQLEAILVKIKKRLAPLFWIRDWFRRDP